MRKLSSQISMFDTYDAVLTSMEESKPELIKLLEAHIDLESLIPEGFYRAFYKSTGREHTYHLVSFLWFFILKKLFSIAQTAQMILILNYVDRVEERNVGSRVDEEVNNSTRSTCSTRLKYLSVEPSYTKTLGEIVDLIKSFHDEPQNLMVPDQADGFAKKLYSTYLAALPEDKFSYPLTMHCDNRGSFTEALHSAERGQVSVNVSRPGIAKGQHWHHTKHEKFLVVSGKGEINFRMADDPNGKVITYKVSGEKLEVVRIPPGYTHNIVNVGETDMVTVMWANEIFDPANPDTFRLEV